MKKMILPALVALMLTACQKKTDCGASVIVNDSQGRPMKGVDVRLFANVKMEPKSSEVTADLKANGYTDENGKVSFVFKLPAIYDIKAISGNNTTLGIIKLEEGKEVSKTVAFQ